MRVACPRLGPYSDIIKELGTYLEWEIVLPPPISERTIQTGAKYMNELMCLPAKITLGSFIEVCELGVDKIVMFDSCGLCRFKSYWVLQQRALRRLGYDVTIYPLSLGKWAASDIRKVDPSISYFRAWGAVIKFIKEVKRLDDSLWNSKEEEDKPKIGIVGEIYTLLEPAANNRLISRLEKLGAYVHNSLPLSYFILKPFYRRGWMERKDMDEAVVKVAEKKAHEYFPKEVGGHGNESIAHTIYYALKKFDGVIHVMPFPCMPESTVASIVDEVSHDMGIPVMRLIFDTQTGEAGLLTRLEAFVDVLRRRRRCGAYTWSQ